MKMNFNVAVIIPVYNTAAFIDKAVQSALSQTETAEVLIINDGSTDQTDAIIKGLAVQDERITILYHPEKENRGRAASRNLGIQTATQDYIAFLDADDFYLDNRFANDKRIFEKQPWCDGVYNAIGAHFYREAGEQERHRLALTTLSEITPPKDLFKTLISHKKGHFSIDGLTVKRSIFKDVGLFDEELLVAEDTQLIWRISLLKHLLPGIIDIPVAMRGVHDENVFNESSLYAASNLKFYESLFIWSSQMGLSIETRERFLERIWIVKNKERRSLVFKIVYWFKLQTTAPKTFFTYLSVKYFPLVLKGRRLLKKYFINKNQTELR